jgi:hypothetical protein
MGQVDSFNEEDVIMKLRVKNKNVRKRESGFISVIALCAIFIGTAIGVTVHESHRLSEGDASAPKYVVEDSEYSAMDLAKKLEDEANDRTFRVTGERNLTAYRATGESNIRSLPFKASFILLEDIPFEDLEEGKFVGYINDEGDPVFHRLMKKTKRGWVAQGDSNIYADESYVTADNLTGRLVEPIVTWQTVVVEEKERNFLALH